jgi:hypothetical protein
MAKFTNNLFTDDTMTTYINQHHNYTYICYNKFAKPVILQNYWKFQHGGPEPPLNLPLIVRYQRNNLLLILIYA